MWRVPLSTSQSENWYPNWMRKWLYDRRQRQINRLGNTIDKLTDTLKTAEPESFEQGFIEAARVNAFQRRNKLVAKQHKECPHVRT